LYILKRTGAEKTLTRSKKAKAKTTFEKLTNADKIKLQQNIIAGLPEPKSRILLKISKVLQGYDGIDANRLKRKFILFLA
jgi:mannonate dehydratase